MPHRLERGDGHHGVGDSERAPHWQSVVSAVLEHNGHRRPGPPDVAMASYRLPAEGAERSELTVAEVGEARLPYTGLASDQDDGRFAARARATSCSRKGASNAASTIEERIHSYQGRIAGMTTLVQAESNNQP
jgi:hypothetical protein